MCPAYLSTGGTELLHQLVYKLINIFNINAYIFYHNVEWKYEFSPTPTKFTKYIGNSWVESVEDAPENIIIIPETLTNMIEKYNHATLWVWWLSIDNFFVTLGKSYTCSKYIKLGIEWRFRKLFNLKPYRNLNTTLFKQNVKLQLYQSEYARIFLKNAGSQNLLPLSDYIDHSLIIKKTEKNIERINQVLYNPIKGLEITTQLIRSFPEIKWVPIVKLKSEEVSKLLASSKVYVDFGNHPGKDRIPREAILNGCCIIVNKEGAAANSLDVDIPAEFKIEDPIKEQGRIISLIKNSFDFYNDQYLKFEHYLNKIIKEEAEFEKEISELIKQNYI
ncbi:MAG: hypothetical protein EOP34_05455 [Rickettsiales bacterium]|nr:MAG: hypothetical protein EOP34_05455 [Rickettsiales bacterium]